MRIQHAGPWYVPFVFDVSGWRHRAGVAFCARRPTFLMTTHEQARQQVGLPLRPFLFTLDQIADMIAMPLDKLERTLVWYAGGRETGAHPRGKLLARNIASNVHNLPEWRVADRELLRWCKHKGFKVHDRAFISR